MIIWPEALLTEVAERRCVIIAGAGVSAAAENSDGRRPPTWTEFLMEGARRIRVDGDRHEAERLVKEAAALDAAQIIEESLGKSDFARFIREVFESPNFSPSRLHELILEIDPKVVVTTNYDTLLESLAIRGGGVAAYNVSRYYDSHLMNDLRSNRRIIVKAHGCISDPQKIVLTRRQYFSARRDHPHFFAALDAVFLTNTLLFVGSGFRGDPDIELMLQNAQISAPSDHPHYAIVESGRHSSVMRALSETYNVKFLEYEKGKHEQVETALEELAESVSSIRALPS